MPLGEPPRGAGSLATVPAEPIRRRLLHRVWRLRAADGTVRSDPWWFASVPRDPADSGRFDLPAPMGTCYTATRAVGAVLEALRMHLTNLPRAELALRRRAEILAPDDAPRAAKLTAQTVVGAYGTTASLWAGSDRALGQRWAAALRRDGWWAVYGGIAQETHPGAYAASRCSITTALTHPRWAARGATARRPSTTTCSSSRAWLATVSPSEIPVCCPTPIHLASVEPSESRALVAAAQAPTSSRAPRVPRPVVEKSSGILAGPGG